MDCPNCSEPFRLRADYAEHLQRCVASRPLDVHDLRHYVAIPVGHPRRTVRLEPRRELSTAGSAPEQQ